MNRSIFVSLACISIEPIAHFWLALATVNRYLPRDFEAIPPADRLISPPAQKFICSRKAVVLLRFLRRLITRVPECAGFKWMTTGRSRIYWSIFRTMARFARLDGSI